MSPEKDDKTDWGKWSNKVLTDLERLESKYEKLDEKFNIMNTEMQVLKAKATIWIGIVSLVFSTIAATISRLVV